jgi:hypothetical protein
MTEYTVKEIGHQWVVYADRLSIAACADEDSALKLIAEDSAANSALRKSAVNGIRQAKTRRREPAPSPLLVRMHPAWKADERVSRRWYASA